MKESTLTNQENILRAEKKIKSKDFDFTATFYAVAELRNIAEKDPAAFQRRNIFALEELMKNSEYGGQRQGFFLFRETSSALAALINRCNELKTAVDVFSCFRRILVSTNDHAHRAAAEALGLLPVSVKGPDIQEFKPKNIPLASLRQILDELRIKSPADPLFFGRSLVIPCSKTKRLLVLKLARQTDTPEGLAQEVLWMNHIRYGDYRFSSRFDIPRPLFIKHSPVFRMKEKPTDNGVPLHPKRFAIAFWAHQEYFSYPNDPESAKKYTGEAFAEILSRNALIAGKLVSRGVVHSALIPLFHNRVQRVRRRDRGVYEWFRAGRLDQWLHSCEHPNLSATGLRDFEHLFSFEEKGLSLYRHIGNQILSLLLVAGSYFRNKNKKIRGKDINGNPLDARNLFNHKLLEKLVSQIFQQYYSGFVGIPYAGSLPFHSDRLAERMIDEMGMDRHMEEILRTADQNQMSDDEFAHFLKGRGFPPDQICCLRRGQTDIVIQSGPHLGGFNERISIPELIEAVASMSGVCIAGKFWMEKFGRSL